MAQLFSLGVVAMKKVLVDIFQSWRNEYSLMSDIAGDRFLEKANPGQQHSLSHLEKVVMIVLVFSRSFSLSHLAGALSGYTARSHFSEGYVVAWFLTLSSLLALWPGATFAAGLGAYRVIDSFTYRLCVLFVDRYQAGWGLRSVNRAIILAFINYLELMIGFAIIYVWSGSIASGDPPHAHVLSGSIEALYFSCVTVATIGYGDFTPRNSLGQGLVIAEVLMGILLLGLVLAALLSGIKNINSLRDDHDA